MTISQAVEKVVKVKPFIMEALSEGLLNISSLARQIHPLVESLVQKDVKQGAIVMALNRLVPSLENSGFGSYEAVLSQIGDIIVRSNLTDYTFRNSATILECLNGVMNQLSSSNDAFYTTVRGVFESTVIIGSDYCSIVDKNFEGEECSFRNDNLSAITLKLPANNVQACGFYYQIMKFIAWEGINVKEVVSTTNEFSIIVAEEDVDRAFTILKNLKTAHKLR
ncbi:MAG: aspartate kinase [Bacteroidales bacterium]|nr:aspartate kinase [Bacteroidales bacterium]